MAKIDDIENKRKILQKFLQIIIFEGVSEESFKKSLEESEIDPKFKDLIFEEGVLGLIKFYIDEIILEISNKIKEKKDFSNLKIRQKISFSVFQIFKIQQKNKEACEIIFNFYFNIKNLQNPKYGVKPSILALRNLLKFSDQIWFLIGDKSTDYNYYTKRLTLSKLIAKSFFVFLKDESENLEQTKNSIDSQIEKIMKFEKFKAKIKNSCQKEKITQNLQDFFLDKNSNLKDPKEIFKSLPFVRLFY